MEDVYRKEREECDWTEGNLKDLPSVRATLWDGPTGNSLGESGSQLEKEEVN